MNEQTAAALKRVADAFGYAIEAVKRAVDAICQTWRKIVVGIATAIAISEHPQANRERLSRHLRTCDSPLTRAGYMLSQARRGHTPPLLA